MILLLVTTLLYALLAWLLVLVWWRGAEALWEVASETGGNFSGSCHVLRSGSLVPASSPVPCPRIWW